MGAVAVLAAPAITMDMALMAGTALIIKPATAVTTDMLVDQLAASLAEQPGLLWLVIQM